MLQQISTPFGPLLAVWSTTGLYACEFQKSRPIGLSTRASSKQKLPSLAHTLEDALTDYFETGQFTWDLETLDWTNVTDFHKSVLRSCYAIPAGSTLTYGQLAATADRPKAARAVGAAMAKNRWPIVIPCHRVVGASGKLTGYSGMGGVATKQSLLDLESKQELLFAQ